MRSRPVVALLLAAACLAAAVAAAFEVPRLEGRVTDVAGLLSAAAETGIEAELERLEADTGAQVAVLTVPSLDGWPIEEASIRVVESWRLGREADDDGVLVMVARDERRIRIEVGYGLEPTLTDAECGRIIDHVLRPAFRRGDFEAGIGDAVAVIGAEIRGTGSVPDRPVGGDEGGELGVVALFVIVLGVFTLAGVLTRGCSGWLLYLFLLPFWWGLAGAGLGSRTAIAVAVGWLVVYPLVRAWVWRSGAGRRFRTAHPGWILVPGGAGRGGSSSGGFSGGFSGGGGSFGGGGASGGW